MKKGRKTMQVEKNNGSSFVFLSFKSSVFVLFAIFTATFIIPVALDALGIGLLWLRVILIGATTAFAMCYAIFFIDSDKGFTRNFWLGFIVLALISTFIAYYWVFGIFFA